MRAQAAGGAPVIAITHVTLIDPALAAPIRDATIVVRGERIMAAGARRSITIPRGATVVDATGKFAIPGLWDMHTHVGQPVASGVDLETGAAYSLPLFIAHGVTGVRDMGGDLSTLRRWRAEIDTGSRVGPRLLNAAIPAASSHGLSVLIGAPRNLTVKRSSSTRVVRPRPYLLRPAVRGRWLTSISATSTPIHDAMAGMKRCISP